MGKIINSLGTRSTKGPLESRVQMDDPLGCQYIEIRREALIRIKVSELLVIVVIGYLIILLLRVAPMHYFSAHCCQQAHWLSTKKLFLYP